MDPTMQSPRTIRLPIGNGIDIPVPSGPHSYRTRSWIGSTSDGLTPAQGLAPLLRHATPGQTQMAEDGKTTTIPILGTVRHKVDPDRLMVVNTTEPDHWLYPGNVHRSIVKDGNDLYVQSDGYGTGIFPSLNSFLAEYFAWPSVDNDIRRELNPQIKPNAYATEMVRDSVAHAGIPDRKNVFEYGYPEGSGSPAAASSPTPASNPSIWGAPNGKATASVFETGTAPFRPFAPGVPRDRASDVIGTADGLSGGSAPGTIREQAIPGGLPGLFAAVAGTDPANPFVPTPPQEDVRARRLISRPAK